MTVQLAAAVCPLVIFTLNAETTNVNFVLKISEA
jgi:hypothetical protein